MENTFNMAETQFQQFVDAMNKICTRICELAEEVKENIEVQRDGVGIRRLMSWQAGDFGFQAILSFEPNRAPKLRTQFRKKPLVKDAKWEHIISIGEAYNQTKLARQVATEKIVPLTRPDHYEREEMWE